MRTKTATIIAAVVFAVCQHAAASAPLEQARYAFASYYEYDRGLPPRLEDKVERETDNYILHHWSFDSSHGKRVTAYFVEPKKAPKPWPVILGMHGYSGSKDEIAGKADEITGAGYAALALDCEYHGERKVEGKAMYSKLKYSSRDAMMQTVVDFRRGIDLLEATPGVDAKRIGFVGGSMGGIIGAVLSAVEPRIKASTLIVGGADWAYLLRASVVAGALGLGTGEHPLKAKDFSRVVAPADPINWAQKISPRPVLMLNGKHDMLVNPPANVYLFNRLGTPKKIVWFDEGHGLPLGPVFDIMLPFFDVAVKKGDANPFGAPEVVEGYKTEPLSMKPDKALPPVVADEPLSELFSYDWFLPLAAQTAGGHDFLLKDARASDISFMSAHDARITAEYAPPGEAGIRNPVVFLRDPGSAPIKISTIPYIEVPGVCTPGSFFRGQADFVAQDDIECAVMNTKHALLAVDAPYAGGRAAAGRVFIDPKLPRETAANIVQAVQDLRRAVDLLEAGVGEIAGASGPVVLVAQGRAAAVPAMIAAALDARVQSLVIVSSPRDAEYEAALSGLRADGGAAWWADPAIYADALRYKSVYSDARDDKSLPGSARLYKKGDSKALEKLLASVN